MFDIPNDKSQFPETPSITIPITNGYILAICPYIQRDTAANARVARIINTKTDTIMANVEFLSDKKDMELTALIKIIELLENKIATASIIGEKLTNYKANHFDNIPWETKNLQKRMKQELDSFLHELTNTEPTNIITKAKEIATKGQILNDFNKYEFTFDEINCLKNIGNLLEEIYSRYENDPTISLKQAINDITNDERK